MFRVTILPAIEHSLNTIISQEVPTLESAAAIRNTVADTLLVLGNSGAMRDYSNSMEIEQIVDGVWEEVEEEDY